MKFYYVYIVECSDGLFYTGITNDLDKRIEQHNAGTKKNAFTFKRRPVQLKWYEQFTDPSQAIQFEKQLKGWNRKKKLAIIQGRWLDLPKLSRNYTEFGKPDDLATKESSTGSD